MGNKQSDIVGTARLTGFWCLTLAITGILGFLVFHPQINETVKCDFKNRA